MNEHETLVIETIDEINVYLPKMIKGIGDFIGFGAENGDSKKLLADIFEGLDWIARAVSLTNKFRPGKMCEYELPATPPINRRLVASDFLRQFKTNL